MCDAQWWFVSEEATERRARAIFRAKRGENMEEYVGGDSESRGRRV